MPLQINDETIPDHVLDGEVLRLSHGLEMDAPNAGNHDPASLRSLALENVITRTLLLQVAATRKIQVTQHEVDVERSRQWGVKRDIGCDPGSMNAFRETMLLGRVRNDLVKHVTRPSRADAERYYHTHPQQFQQLEAVEAAHIFCGFSCAAEEPEALSKILQAKNRLANGEPFPQVAERHSDCKGVGGAVGWVTRGTMVPEFEDVVFGLAVGRLSDVFRTIFGFHLAKALRRRAGGAVPFHEVRLQIGRQLHAEAQTLAMRHILAQMKAASVIRFSEESIVG